MWIILNDIEAEGLGGVQFGGGEVGPCKEMARAAESTGFAEEICRRIGHAGYYTALACGLIKRGEIRRKTESGGS